MKPVLALFLLSVFLFLFPGRAMAVTVALDEDYPPYSFRSPEGRLQGISVDLWDLWSKKTGEPVTLRGLPWNQALLAMDQGTVDVLDTVFFTPERARRWAFSEPYAIIKVAVFQREGLSGIREPRDLKGYLVGVKAGDAGADALRSSPVGKPVEYPNYGALVDAAARGEVLAFCMDVPPAVHLLLSRNLGAQFRQAFVLSQDSFRRAVSRERPDLLILVDRGFSSISAQEREAIDLRWTGSLVSGSWDSQAILAAVVSGLLIIGLLLGFVLFLRRQVVRRTGQLLGTQERLKSSEDRARALIAALPDLLYILDSGGTIRETLGPVHNQLYRNPERFLGQTLEQAFGPVVAKETRDKLAELVEVGGVATVESDLEIRGEMRNFEARIVRLVDGSFLSIVRDVSVNRRAWLDDLRRNKLESLGLLAGGLAHDFNNCLGIIQGFVSLARIQLSQPEKALESLDKAVLATRRAAGLTSQLRVLAHGSDVNRTLLSVRTVAEEAAAFALVGSSCVLSVEAGDGPWEVEADPDQLSQVFHNLVINAVQAMPRGGPITLVFRRTHQKISVSVVDEGEGISKDQLERVFDPYFTTKPQGSGLGLSVVQAVVQKHGGLLEVDSRVSRGSVFTVTLPAAQGQVLPLPPKGSWSQQEFEGRVLVMEDESELRCLIVEVCSSLGFTPTATRNGTEALAAFQAAEAEGRPFGLLISDLLVPGDMGGRELVSRLRTRPSKFRALAVTGFSVDRQVEDFQDQGFDVIVGKPFTVDELKARIGELMKSPWKTVLNT